MRAGAPAQLLHLAAPFLRGDPLLAGTRFRFGGPPFFWSFFGLFEKRAQPSSRRLPVLRLSPMLAAVDEEDVVRNHPVPGEVPQPFLHLVWKRRRADVEAQFDRRGHFVDVLPARARGSNEALFYVSFVHNHVVAAMLTSRLPIPPVPLKPRPL
jgi:hypothetical protein